MKNKSDESPGTEDEDEDDADVDMGDSDDASFASVERNFSLLFAHDLNRICKGAAHMLELSKLAGS